MKCFKQALDWRNPRSLWHRSACTGIGECCAVLGFFVFVVAGLPIGATLVTVLAAVLLFNVVAPMLCRVSITFYADDSESTLRQLLNATAHSPFTLPPHYAWLADCAQFALGVGLCLWASHKAANRFAIRDYRRAIPLALVTPLFPLIPALITLVVASGLSFFFAGCAGSLFDGTGRLLLWSGASLPKNPFPLSAVTALRFATDVLSSRVAGFYPQLAAFSVLLGTLAGACVTYAILAGLLCALPYHFFARLRQDVKETMHDIV